jgi:hypothetical protein
MALRAGSPADSPAGGLEAPPLVVELPVGVLGRVSEGVTARDSVAAVLDSVAAVLDARNATRLQSSGAT